MAVAPFTTEYQERMKRVLGAAQLARTPLLLTSPPGYGKTAFLRSYAAEKELHIEVETAANKEPTDFLGLPFRTEHSDGTLVAENALPRWFHELLQRGRGMLFIDELSIAPPAVQGAVLTLMQDRAIGQHRLSDDVIIAAAANPIDSAAGGYPFAPPLSNRMCHLDWKPPYTDIVQGIAEGWGSADIAVQELLLRSKLASFLKVNTARIHEMPEDLSRASGPWPSPRSWDNAVRACAYLQNEQSTMEQVLAGFVGQAAAVAFIQYSIELQMPDPYEVLNGEATPNWSAPDMRTDAAWATLSSVLAITAQDPERWFDKAVDVFISVAGTRSMDAGGALAQRLFEVRPKPKPGTVASPSAIPENIRAFLKAYNELFHGAGRAAKLN